MCWFESDLVFDNKSNFSFLLWFHWIINQDDKYSPDVCPDFTIPSDRG